MVYSIVCGNTAAGGQVAAYTAIPTALMFFRVWVILQDISDRERQ